jgi:hypothetical protein
VQLYPRLTNKLQDRLYVTSAKTSRHLVTKRGDAFALRAILSHGYSESNPDGDRTNARIKLFNTIVSSAYDEVMRSWEKPADMVTQSDREAFQSSLTRLLTSSVLRRALFMSYQISQRRKPLLAVPCA